MSRAQRSPDAENRSARQQVLDTAARLFYTEGYRAVGVDTIVAESGVSKMTLYRHFPSKDDLIVAYLEESNRQFWAWFERATASHAGDARGQLHAFFASLAELASKPSCCGCPFLNVAVDFPQRDHPGHQVALAHKNAVRERFQVLAAAAGARDPELLANELLLLMDGAFMAVRLFGTDSPACHVDQAAATLIAAQISAN